MSLLLDALKKAADEKEKNKQKQTETETPEDVTKEEQQDLDLDLVTEDYPLVDEGFIKSEISDDQASEQVELSLQQDVETQDISRDQELDETAETVPADQTENAVDELDQDVLESMQVETANVQQSKEVREDNSQMNLVPDRRKPEPSKFDRTVQYDPAALDALINKSNQNSRASKLRNRILYAVVIVVILLSTGVYFALQVMQSTDSIYVADSNMVQRHEISQPVPQESVTAVKVSEPAVQFQPPVQTSTKVTKANPVVKSKPVTPVTTEDRKVTIIHKKMEDPTDVLLQKAYVAFTEGDYATAKKHYQSVMDLEDKNKDAMLGLAAVAIKEQRFDYARQKYLQMLYLDPLDTYAKAGLNSIEAQQGTAYSESQLKMMLREQPEAGHLHFALGSLYASQEKWPDAQAAFFNAWSADSDNADYAFNLAVSLDHLDKSRQAIELYELSVKVHNPATSNFSTDDVQSRIRALKDASQESN